MNQTPFSPKRTGFVFYYQVFHSVRIGILISLAGLLARLQSVTMRRKVTNLFITGMLVIMLLDGMPSTGSLHDRARQSLDPWLDATGLWQGHWALFAPDVLKRNARVSADLEADNGLAIHWKSPLFQDLTITGRFRAFREGEFFDNIRNDEFSGAWDSVADYLGRTEFPSSLPGLKLARVRLRRHWWDIPPPGAKTPPPTEQWYQFHIKEFQQ